MLDIVCFKWKPPAGYRSTHKAEHVNVMRSMIARNYPHPHRFTCITDDPAGLDPRVRFVPLWDLFSDMKSPHGGNNPACYRRLYLHSDWARQNVGERVLQIDLDMLLVDDVSSLWNRSEPYVMWKDALNPTTPYNGAMQLFSPGGPDNVYDVFSRDPVHWVRAAQTQQYWGSDQGVLAAILGPDQARWSEADGAISWRKHCMKSLRADTRVNPHCVPLLPEGARVVNFHGHEDPWDIAPIVPWIAEHYR